MQSFTKILRVNTINLVAISAYTIGQLTPLEIEYNRYYGNDAFDIFCYPVFYLWAILVGYI